MTEKVLNYWKSLFYLSIHNEHMSLEDITQAQQHQDNRWATILLYFRKKRRLLANIIADK